MTAINLDYYKAIIKAWPKQAGPVVTPAQLETAHLLCPAGRRQGVEMLWVAMLLREGGASVRQFLLASGANGTAHNYLNDKVRKPGLGVRVPCGGEGRAFVWRLDITAKGQKVIDKARAALSTASEPAAEKPKAKASKPARVRKPKAPAPVDAEVPASAPAVAADSVATVEATDTAPAN